MNGQLEIKVQGNFVHIHLVAPTSGLGVHHLESDIPGPGQTVWDAIDRAERSVHQYQRLLNVKQVKRINYPPASTH